LESRSYPYLPIELEGGTCVDFSFPINNLEFGNSSHYQVMAFTNDFYSNNVTEYIITDYTRPTIVPPRQFDFLASPIEIRQVSIQTTELTIKSNINFNSTVLLSAAFSSGVNVNIPTDILSIAPNGIAKSTLQVSASSEAEANMTRNIPITMDITLTPGSNASAFENYIEYIPEREKIGLVPAQSYSVTAQLPAQSRNITATILEPLPLVQFPPIPQEYLVALYASILTFLIPSFAKMINATTAGVCK
jgi:hypothetical protein